MKADAPIRLVTDELLSRPRALWHLAAWSAVEAVPALLSGSAVAAALDQGFLRGRVDVGLAWLGLMVLAAGVRAVAVRAMFPWLAQLVEPLRDALVDRVVTATLRRAVDGTDQPDSAGITRLTSQVEMVRNLVSALLRMVRQLGVTIIATLAGLATLAPAVAAIVVGPLVIGLVLFAVSLRRMAGRQYALVLVEEQVAAETGRVFGAVRDVVACGAQARAGAALDDLLRRQVAATAQLARMGAWRSLVIAVGGHLPVVLTVAAAPWLVGSAHLSVGQVVGAITYLVANLVPALRTLTDLVGAWGLQLGVLLRRLHVTTQVAPKPAQPAAAAQPASNLLQARGLTFAYGPGADPVVDGLDLTVHAGEHLTVIGPSGIGKSTLAQLLTGSVAADRGDVRLGGVLLVDMADADRLAHLALIPQEAYVFTGTVRDNLSYLAPDVTDAALDQAVDVLGARELVDRLGGYPAPIGGARLSAGERQLIALVRVFVSAARVVVLDEATCHLDPVAEARVELAFAERTGSLIVIAHRISSARRADRILLLDGATATSGSHDELLRDSALYAELVGHWHTGQEMAVA